MKEKGLSVTDQEKLEKGVRIRQTMSTPGWQDIQEYLLEENRRLQHLAMKQSIPNPCGSDPRLIPNTSRETGFLSGAAYQIKRILISFSRLGKNVAVTDDIRQFLRGQYSVTSYFTQEFPNQAAVAAKIERSLQEEE